MQDREETILVEYGKADFGQRLQMFLTYRELRHQFIDIDRGETPLKQPALDVPLKLGEPCRRVVRKLGSALNSLIRLIKKIGPLACGISKAGLP